MKLLMKIKLCDFHELVNYAGKCSSRCVMENSGQITVTDLSITSDCEEKNQKRLVSFDFVGRLNCSDIRVQ